MSIINNYLKDNQSNEIDEDNNSISLKSFKNAFSKFIDKANEIDAEFELIKKEFKEREEEYRRTNKEIINASLQNNPLLKNYEEIFNDKEKNNDSISSIANRNENNSKKIKKLSKEQIRKKVLLK